MKLKKESLMSEILEPNELTVEENLATPKKVLITGCYGFIGYSVAVHLLKQGHTVYGLDKVQEAISPKSVRIQNLSKFTNFHFHDVNLINFEQTKTLLNMIDFDHVIHMAGQYSVAYSSSSMLSFIDGNIRSWMHVMDCAKKKKIKRVIYASSTFVQDGMIPTSMYGATLEFRERAANVYSASFDMETVGLRFGSTYGPYIRPDVGIYIISNKLWDGIPINVEEGGFKYKSGFLYIADAVEVVVRLLDKPLPQKHNVFTVVANDRVRDLGEILELIEKYSGKQSNRVGTYTQLEPGYIPTERMLPLKDVINYMPHTTIEEGVKKFAEWFGKRKEAGKNP
jgi:UDP-glucuronate 4-epimerase